MNFKKSEPAIIWKRVNCQQITSKKKFELDGPTPEPAIRSGNTGQRIPCFDSCQLNTTLMCNQRSPGLPKLESVRVNIGITVVRTDGRSVPRSVGHVITQFFGMVHLFIHGASLGRFARGAPLWINNKTRTFSRLFHCHKMHLLALFRDQKDRFFYLFIYFNGEMPTFSFNWSLKRYPFRAGPPRIRAILGSTPPPPDLLTCV